MRKQTKIVAVASAAAILAIGASMTSFAATGWVEEDGVWYYYDKDGNKVEDEWKKSGDSWYWLDSEEDGGMAVDKLIEDGDNTYYVDSNGTMVKNTWVKVVNEDQDDDDDPAEYNYYYMQSNGKAYKAGDTTSTKFRTIDGKRYAFDDDGKMLYGWVDGNGARLSGEDDWANPLTDDDAMYYCGSWDDGAMKTGWQRIYVHDADEDDDMEHWFYFKSNGKKEYNNEDGNIKEKKINGKRYGFDIRGVMVYEWTLATGGTNSASASDWKYFSSPEDGARKTKGWFKVVAPSDDNTFNSEVYSGGFASKHADDEDEKWYYADGDGKLAQAEIKKIKGKYYAFRPDDGEKGAAMLSGLVLMEVKDGKIVDVADDGVDTDELSDILDGKKTVEDGYTLYYFGNDADSDGAMKTGSTTVTLDGDSYNFYFSKSGGVENRGKGVSGIDDDKYIYMYGCRIKADSDDKYQVVQVHGSDDTITSTTVKVNKFSSQTLRTSLAVGESENKDGEIVKYVPTAVFKYAGGVEADGEEYMPYQMYLVNTSGTIVKSKTAAKDGADWYFYVEKKQIKMYTNNKTLTDTSLTKWKTEDIKVK